MKNAHQCPACGNEIDANSDSGCPACQFELGIGEGTSVDSAPGAPFTVEELAAKFDHLEVQELLGVGGMGAVYAAQQNKLDRTVALKIVRPDISNLAEFEQRFEREAKTLARLNHPNIVSIYDFGKVDGIFYYIMEHVDGMDLSELADAGTLTPSESLDIVSQVCSAMQYAHENGIVHRDIKPTNILVGTDGMVKIADFGLAKLYSGDALTTKLTQTNQVFGTPRYMAPEQVEASGDVDHRADIYSLGVVFYELLTGELPLGRFDPPSKRVEVDVRLDEVVMRALEKHPERRYQAVKELSTDIGKFSTVAETSAKGVTPPDKDRPCDTTAMGINVAAKRHAPWYVPPLMITGSILLGFGLFHASQVFNLKHYEKQDLWQLSIIFGFYFSVVGTIVLFTTWGVWKWRRPETFATKHQIIHSPVQKMLTRRSLTYVLTFCLLFILGLPWIEVKNGSGSLDSFTGGQTVYLPWFLGVLLVGLAVLVFIDIYEGVTLYFSAASILVGLGIGLLLIAMGAGELIASETLVEDALRTLDSREAAAILAPGFGVAAFATICLIGLGAMGAWFHLRPGNQA